MSNKPYNERGWFTPQISDEQIIARCEEVWADGKGKYPSHTRCGLPISGARFHRVRNVWMAAKGIEQSKHFGGRIAKPRQPLRVDCTKPAMIAAGLGESPIPKPPDPDQPPKDPDALASWLRKLECEASVRAYKASRWDRAMKETRA